MIPVETCICFINSQWWVFLFSLSSLILLLSLLLLFLFLLPRSVLHQAALCIILGGTCACKHVCTHAHGRAWERKGEWPFYFQCTHTLKVQFFRIQLSVGVVCQNLGKPWVFSSVPLFMRGVKNHSLALKIFSTDEQIPSGLGCSRTFLSNLLLDLAR